MAALLKVWIFAISLSLYNCQSTASNVYYVRPSEPNNASCTHQPCLTLNEYALNANRYFVNNTKFVFIPGIHWLNHSVQLENLSNFVLQISNDDALQLKTSIRLFFSPLVNVTWTSCVNVEVSNLDMVLGGTYADSVDHDTTSIFSALVFHRSTIRLSNLSIHGNATLQSTTILLNDSSSAVISTLSVQGATSITGAAIYAVKSVVEFHGHNTFRNNVAPTFTHGGGALALYECNSTFLGQTLFHNNSAKHSGAAVVVTGGTIDLHDTLFLENQGGYGRCGGALSISDVTADVTFDNVSFIGNFANCGGAVAFSGNRVTVTGDGLFANNLAEQDGGALALERGNLRISGNFQFIGNMCGRHGGAMFFGANSSNFSGTFLFLNNSASMGGAVLMYASSGISVMNGSLMFVNNQATKTGGALYSDTSEHSHVLLTGNVTFINNNASGVGGAVSTQGTGSITFAGLIRFFSNHADIPLSISPVPRGGAICAYTVLINLEGQIVFEENSANFELGLGGAVYATGATINLTGTIYFSRNSAKSGGAIALDYGYSKLLINEPLQLTFVENRASEYGGAIYSSQVMSADQCSESQFYIPSPDCFIQLSDYYSSDIHFTFTNNTADKTGRILYGGALDKCKLYEGGGEIDNCGHRTGGNYDYRPIEKLLSISEIHSVDDRDRLDISSVAQQVCVCKDDIHSIECSHVDTEETVVHGKEFTLKVVTVGQNEGLVASSVRVAHSNDVEIDAVQTIQNTSMECTPIKYRLFSESNDTSLVLFPDDSLCRDVGIYRKVIKVTFEKCPDGFEFSKAEKTCSCEKRLRTYTKNCNIDNSSIQHTNSDRFWMGALYVNGSYLGLILHSSCPLDYCVDYNVSITLDDLDIQCNHNHSGTLCGSCRGNYSIAFGTLHCLRCSNQYLALILPFALAGIALVAVILLLNISVAGGAINGLIFYVNIIQINRSIFFPLDEINVLTVFVAWLNLDLGIETCFYDGMTIYAFTWLQFLFPFYVWFLIGSIIVVTHYSHKATILLGDNPVAALATLFLLSYSKILRTTITALTITHLDYPDDTKKWVWVYNASVPYFQHADHIFLGLFSIAILLVLFLPYTFLLTCGHCLQAYSHRRSLSWMNKIKPFMDAYHAPYKKGTRYWTGFLLLVRCVLFLIFALNTFGDDNLNLLATTSAATVLLALASLHGGIYQSTFVNILETSFIVNLCLFSAATYYVKQTSLEGKQAPWLAYTFVGIAFVVFIAIVLYHIYLTLRKTPFGKKLHTCIGKHNEEERGFVQSQCSIKDSDLAAPPPTTFIDIREYEPLLDRN